MAWSSWTSTPRFPACSTTALTQACALRCWTPGRARYLRSDRPVLRRGSCLLRGLAQRRNDRRTPRSLDGLVEQALAEKHFRPEPCPHVYVRCFKRYSGWRSAASPLPEFSTRSSQVLTQEEGVIFLSQ